MSRRLRSSRRRGRRGRAGVRVQLIGLSPVRGEDVVEPIGEARRRVPEVETAEADVDQQEKGPDEEHDALEVPG